MKNPLHVFLFILAATIFFSIGIVIGAYVERKEKQEMVIEKNALSDQIKQYRLLWSSYKELIKQKDLYKKSVEEHDSLMTDRAFRNQRIIEQLLKRDSINLKNMPKNRIDDGLHYELIDSIQTIDSNIK